MTIEIVDFPIRNGDFLQQTVSHYQTVYLISNEGSPQWPSTSFSRNISNLQILTGYWVSQLLSYTRLYPVTQYQCGMISYDILWYPMIHTINRSYIDSGSTEIPQSEWDHPALPGRGRALRLSLACMAGALICRLIHVLHDFSIDVLWGIWGIWRNSWKFQHFCPIHGNSRMEWKMLSVESSSIFEPPLCHRELEAPVEAKPCEA